MNTLRSVSVNNYKSFLKETGGANVECAPITLLYGHNHAGKSALLRGVGLFVDSSFGRCGSPPLPGLLNFEFPPILGSSIDDLVSRGMGLPIEFAIELADPEMPETLHLSWSIRRMNDTSRLIVELFEAARGGRNLRIEYAPDTHGSDAYEVRVDNNPPSPAGSGLFGGLLPELAGIADCEFWQQCLESLAPLTCQWLSPTRLPIRRTFALQATTPAIQSNGEGCEQLIAREAQQLTPSPLLARISSWMGRHLRMNLSVRPNGSQKELICQSVDDPLVWVNLVDAGQGVQELLPVLTLLSQDHTSPRLLLIEEPESHLHPNLHSGLGELFAEYVIRNPASMVMVETHSENLLLSLQLQIAEGVLPPESVVVYWVRWSSEGFSQINRISFDALGVPQGAWPPGVFSEDIVQARRLLRIQKERAPVS